MNSTIKLLERKKIILHSALTNIFDNFIQINMINERNKYWFCKILSFMRCNSIHINYRCILHHIKYKRHIYITLVIYRTKNCQCINDHKKKKYELQKKLLRHCNIISYTCNILSSIMSSSSSLYHNRIALIFFFFFCGCSSL